MKFKGRPMSLCDYRKELIDQLLSRDGLYRQRARKGALIGSSSLVDGESVCRLVRLSDLGLSRGRCYQCLKNKKRAGIGKVCFTVYGCSCCKIRLCKINCFDTFHRHF